MKIALPQSLLDMKPSERADAIYRASQSEIRTRLFSAALGDVDRAQSDDQTDANSRTKGPIDLLALLSASARKSFETPAVAPAGMPFSETPANFASEPSMPSDMPFGDPLRSSSPTPAANATLELGANAMHSPAIEAASRRTGIAPAALAAIVDAEAAKKRDGTWNTASRNPRSSAAGLTQFLSGTWEGEAERPGTFLNSLARANGWLNSKGQVESSARSRLLSLRLDARCSIEAAADYAKANVSHLAKAGIKISDDPAKFAQMAYLGHHLGAGDAIDFLKGGLSSAHAKNLLCAQVGTAEANRRIQAAGCPATAHRNWLSHFVDARINIAKFIGLA